MSLFEGEFKKKPLQSFRGSSTNKIKENVIYEAQLCRKRREVNHEIDLFSKWLREQNYFATKIQAAIKGHLTRKKQKAKLRLRFDTTMNHLDENNPRNFPDMFFESAQTLLYFYDTHTDSERLLKLSKLWQTYLTKSCADITGVIKSYTDITCKLAEYDTRLNIISRFYSLLVGFANQGQSELVLTIFDNLAKSISTNFLQGSYDNILVIYSHVCQKGYFELLINLLLLSISSDDQSLSSSKQFLLSLFISPIYLLKLYEMHLDEGEEKLIFDQQDILKQKILKYQYNIFEAFSTQVLSQAKTYTKNLNIIIFKALYQDPNYSFMNGKPLFPISSFIKYYYFSISCIGMNLTIGRNINFCKWLQQRWVFYRTNIYFIYGFGAIGLNTIQSSEKSSELIHHYLVILGHHLYSYYSDFAPIQLLSIYTKQLKKENLLVNTQTVNLLELKSQDNQSSPNSSESDSDSEVDSKMNFSVVDPPCSKIWNLEVGLEIGRMMNSKPFISLLLSEIECLSDDFLERETDTIDAMVAIICFAIFTLPSLTFKEKYKDCNMISDSEGLYNESKYLNTRLFMNLASNHKFMHILWDRIQINSKYTANKSSNFIFKSLRDSISSNAPRWMSTNSPLKCFIQRCELFTTLVNVLFSTLDDQDIFHQENIFNSKSDLPSFNPFSPKDVIQFVRNFKELCLLILDLLFPQNANLLVKRDWVSFYSYRQPWVRVFKRCASFLNQLRIRYSRNNFGSSDMWLAGSSIDIKDTKINNNHNHTNALDIFDKGFFKALKHLNQLDQSKTQKAEPISKTFYGSLHTSPSLSMSLHDDSLDVFKANNLGTKMTFFPDPETGKLLSILHYIPFVIPFYERVKLFRSNITRDKSNYQNETMSYMALHTNVIHVNVRRNYIYEDSFEKLSSPGINLKLKVLVHMTNAIGLDEAGIDGGGVFREFLTDLLKSGFDPNRGLFVPTGDYTNSLYPNPSSELLFKNYRAHYYFLGRMLGKALYENLLVEIPLASFFLKLLCRPSLPNNYSDLDDLASLDPILYKNVKYVKNYSSPEFLSSDLQLDFSVIEDRYGQIETINLLPNGSNILVDADNRIQYVYLLADYKLNKQIKGASQAFKSGLADVINIEWLHIFDPIELQTLISGTRDPIDVNDLRVNTSYSNGYNESHPVIKIFWKVVESFTESERAKLLKFATSCSRPPLLGFKELYPNFCIQNAGPDVERLPTASTCMNLLKLPNITDYNDMKQKILYAINSYAGFELS